MSRLVEYLFGTPRIELDGESIQISWRKVVALLAYLTATGTPHSCDSLAMGEMHDHPTTDGGVLRLCHAA